MAEVDDMPWEELSRRCDAIRSDRRYRASGVLHKGSDYWFEIDRRKGLRKSYPFPDPATMPKCEVVILYEENGVPKCVRWTAAIAAGALPREERDDG